jgi:hypothetical protein
MYSSVPTKEFDARIGSAMKIGFCWTFFCFFLFFSFVLGIKSCKEHNQPIRFILMSQNILDLCKDFPFVLESLFVFPEEIYAKEN